MRCTPTAALPMPISCWPLPESGRWCMPSGAERQPGMAGCFWPRCCRRWLPCRRYSNAGDASMPCALRVPPSCGRLPSVFAWRPIRQGWASGSTKPAGRRVHWDASMYALYGVDTLPPVTTYDEWRGAVLPEDLPAVEAALQAAIRERKQFRGDFRIRRGDGQIRMISALARPLLPADGATVRVVGINQDVTRALASRGCGTGQRSLPESDFRRGSDRHIGAGPDGPHR
jgi:hypothetical protein